MTNKERMKMALRMLNDACISMDFECDCKNNCDEYCFMRMSREALEKQIPERFTMLDNCGNETCTERCPECFEMVDAIWNYCPECGQRIDWSEEE